jgi:transcriptional regulator with XRE-family HTH domain
MSYKKVKKNMTYEQIGNEVGISPQQVHKIEKEALNKMVSRLANLGTFNIFEIIIGLSNEFGVEPHQIFGKLDIKNKETLYEFVETTYGKHVDFERSKDILEDFFE